MNPAMNQPMHQAIELAADTYQAFMTEVVVGRVIQDREGVPNAKKQKALDAGRIIDTRVVRLMAVSGKGGWPKDPGLRERYAESANVTLLDVLESMTIAGARFDWFLKRVRGSQAV